jgi:hypothetical protein
VHIKYGTTVDDTAALLKMTPSLLLLLLLLQVDTKDILFVVGGAFIDLERQLMDSRHKSSIGFGNKVRFGHMNNCGGRAAMQLLKCCMIAANGAAGASSACAVPADAALRNASARARSSVQVVAKHLAYA